MPQGTSSFSETSCELDVLFLEEHDDPLQLLRVYADLLMGSESNPSVAVTVWQLVQSIGQDMREEEAQVLSPEFLSDRIAQNVETG